MRTTDEIRNLYLEFFKSKGHAIIPSASLIPENDPTVLFTTAGMHPLVPYLLGEPHPGGSKLASCQKCIRTGDIDEVGDTVHLTFFEMLGNWALGDYFKKEAIEMSFEFLTSEKFLDIDPNRLYVSVFEGDTDAPRDDELIAEWQKNFASKNIKAKVGNWKNGVDEEEKIFTYPKSKNWWGPAGEAGPCGPDTEMFYDTLNFPDRSAHAPDWTEKNACHPNCDCGRYIEIWNDVFMQYNKTKEGTYTPLKQKNVDTGMGLERTVAVLNGKQSVFEIDSFIEPFQDLLSAHVGDNRKSAVIIADHLKASIFMLGDGILPSNKERGYVLRKLIRRSVAQARKLDIPIQIFSKWTNNVIDFYKSEYKNLENEREKIVKNLTKEAEGFEKILEEVVENMKKEFSNLEAHTLTGKEIKVFHPKHIGKETFLYHQSKGLPKEIIKEIIEDLGHTFDEKGFKEEFRKHQELSRTASAGAFKGGLVDNSEQVTKYHTATHLLHKALREVLGNHIEQKGSNITHERLRFDFSHPRKVISDEITRVEQIVNEKIKEDLPVRFEMLTVKEAKKMGTIGLFEEKYKNVGGKVKVYFIGDYSAEICGGPHVARTGEIGKFKIMKEEAVAAGVRRIRGSIET